MAVVRCWVGAGLAAIATGCAAVPPWHFEGATRFVFRGTPFDAQLVRSESHVHFAFAKPDCEAEEGSPVWLFLDGDGRSWIRHGRAPRDPTPEMPLALELLRAGGACGLYLSRPCTFGLARTDPACSLGVWTVERYSERVLRSLAQAIVQVAPGERPLVLVGHSGGGLLAAHLAGRIARVRGLITLASNLDLEAWVAHHGYTREILERSPGSPFPLDPPVAQLHVFGGRDDIAPLALAAPALARDRSARVLVLPSANHTHGWVEQWPRIQGAFEVLLREGSR